MSPLDTFPLPLPDGGPPAGYAWEPRDVSQLSATTACRTGIDQRDRFLGKGRCIVCGSKVILQHCHIIPSFEQQTWDELRERNWLPDQAKDSVSHEPRNGLLMCSFHHDAFDGLFFFIRFIPESRKFVFVNFSRTEEFDSYHNKAVGLDVSDTHAPFAALFIIHEMRVRGRWLFRPVNPDVDDDAPWQDWITTQGVLRQDRSQDLFYRVSQTGGGASTGAPAQPQFQSTPENEDKSLPPGRTALVLNDDVINKILAATRASNSWKACILENTSWDGTAEENIKKYRDIVGEGFTYEPVGISRIP